MSGTPGRRPLSVALQLALLGAVGWGVYRALAPELSELSWSALVAWDPSLGLLGLSLILLLGVYLAHAFLWRRIISDLGLGKLSARDTVRIYFTASLGRYLPGKLWQLAGLTVLAGRAGVPAAGAAAAAVLGQIGFLGTGLLFLAILLPRWLGGAVGIVAAAVLVATAAFGWLLIVAPSGVGLRGWLLERLSGRLRDRLSEAFEAASLIRPATALYWVAGYGTSWVVLGLAFTVFVAAFVPEAFAETRTISATVAVAYLTGYMILIAPAGLGAREATMAGMLAQVAVIPAAGAIVLPVLSRVWFTAAELLPFLLVPFLSDERRMPTRSRSRSGPTGDKRA